MIVVWVSSCVKLTSYYYDYMIVHISLARYFFYNRRVFEMLGFDDLDWSVKGHDDGLQVLRYNKTKAYTPHMDYMTDPTKKEVFVSLIANDTVVYCFKMYLSHLIYISCPEL
jgi:hypothetical protein